MARPLILSEEKKHLEQIEATFAASERTKQARNASVEALVAELETARHKVVIELGATSHAAQFQSFLEYVTRSRDTLYGLIREKGSLETDIQPIVSARALMDAIDSHRMLRSHVHLLEQQNTQLSTDLSALHPSMQVLMTCLDRYIADVTGLYQRYVRDS